MAVFLANIGVNASHRLRSPLRRDGTFAVLPIPEREEWRPPMLRLADLPGLAGVIPPAMTGQAIHLDPDLLSPIPTYGDNCRRAARAYGLRRATLGDRLVFLARLHPDEGVPGFYLVGELVIADVLADVVADPGPGWWDGNAHIRRARAHGRWDSFWVFRGGPGSRFYETARPFGRPQAEAMFDEPWLWRAGRTDLQTIGSYTRTIRRVAGAE